MSYQLIKLHLKVKENPVFTETEDGKKFAEIQCLHNFVYSDKSGSKIEIYTPFLIVLNESISKLANRIMQGNFILIEGYYHQRIENEKILHEVVATSIKKVEKKIKKEILIEVRGNIAFTPLIKHSTKGNQYVRTSIAADSQYRTSIGRDIRSTTFYNVLAIGEITSSFNTIKKGDYVEIKGNLELKPYQSKSGENRVDSTIFVNEVKKITFDKKDMVEEMEFKRT